MSSPDALAFDMDAYWAQKNAEKKIHRIVAECVCAECAGCLIAPYDHEGGGIVLRCSKNKAHQGYVRPDRELDRLIRMGAKPEEIQEFLESRQRRKGKRAAEAALEGQNMTTALEQYRANLNLTRKEADLITMTLWPNAPPLEQKKAAMLCVAYQLNPLMKHVYILGPYKDEDTGRESWALALGIGAKRLLASRKHAITCTDGPRKMTPDEETAIYGAVDDSKFRAIVALRDLKTGAEVRGYGWWPAKKQPHGTNKGNSIENMAFIRAEGQALNKLAPAEMSGLSDVEVVDEAYMPNIREVHAEVIERPADYHELPEAAQQSTGAAGNRTTDCQKATADRLLHETGWGSNAMSTWLLQQRLPQSTELMNEAELNACIKALETIASRKAGQKAML